MATLQEQIAQAKAAGYNDADIAKHLSAKPDLAPKIKAATEAGYKPEEIITHLSGGKAESAKAPETSLISDIRQASGNLNAGLVRGAGSIGATLLAPLDMAKDAIAGKGLSLESNRQRRADMDAGLKSLGAETDSAMYGIGKLGGEVAGTLGVGSTLGLGAKAVGAAPSLVNALTTGGMKAGQTPGAMNMLTRVVGGAATGAASAGLVNPTDAVAGALVGGVLPPALAGAGKVGSGVASGLRGGPVSPEVTALASRAKELGIDIPADRIGNSKPMNALASGLNYVPFSGRAATEAKMNAQLTKAATRTFGQDSDNMTQALRKASDVLGAEFDNVLKNNEVHFTQKFMNDITGIYNTAEKELASDSLKPIISQLDEIISKASTGTIDGQAAYNIKKTLDRIGRSNRPEAYHALQLKGALMDALNESIGPQAASAFSKTRQQYGNMLALEKLAKNGADGEISIARLANMQNINNQPLQEIADIAAQFVKPREGQHGAMQRGFAAMGIGGLTGPAGLAATAAGGRVGNMLLNSAPARSFALGQPGALGTGFNALMDQTAPALYRSAPVLTTSR